MALSSSSPGLSVFLYAAYPFLAGKGLDHPEVLPGFQQVSNGTLPDLLWGDLFYTPDCLTFLEKNREQ